MDNRSVVVVGAGPAGLTAAHELVKHGLRPVVYERGDRVGGIARTETYKGYRFDIGGHRFFTKVPEVQKLWADVMGDQFIDVPRLSRIYFGGKFYNYPLSIPNVVGNLGPLETLRILASYVAARVRPLPKEDTFEEWVTNRFGDRIYRTFFKTYTEKVWGIPCREIRADWAAQRIKGLSLTAAVINALFGAGDAKTLINEFKYPRLGPGQMWERFAAEIERMGGTVELGAEVVAIHRREKRIESITVKRGGKIEEAPVDHLIGSMPVSRLLTWMDPAPPAEVLAAARGLKYRDFLIVTLIVNKPELFPDNWIYIHAPNARVGRIQNFKNWSKDMLPDPSKTSLGMEYFCSAGDDLWKMGDADLVRLAAREIEELGLAKAADVEDGCVIRQPKAYPVYDGDYRAHLDVIKAYLETFENLQTIGRNGMHRYNNQDHSMLCGLYAARNVLGAKHDLWDVNTERSYHEEQRVTRPARAARGAGGALAVAKGSS